MKADACPVCNYDDLSLEMKNEHGAYYACNLCGHNWLDASKVVPDKRRKIIHKRTHKIMDVFSRHAMRH